MGHTSMLTRCPWPLSPPTIAVTTTRVSAPTKFRIHRGVSSASGWAYNSNLRACVSAMGERRSVRNGGKRIAEEMVEDDENSKERQERRV